MNINELKRTKMRKGDLIEVIVRFGRRWSRELSVSASVASGDA